MMQPNGVVHPPQIPIDPQQHHQYQQPPPQQWMIPPPQPQPQPQTQLPPYWPQQPTYAPSSASPAAQGNPNEVRSLWIGDLQHWMDEKFLQSCFMPTGELVSAKVIKNKQTQQSEGYGFLEFRSRAAAEQILQTYNGTPMGTVDQNFRLNWASMGAGERRTDDGTDHTIFVGDLAAEVTDYMLQETFRVLYHSVKGAKVVTDISTGRSKGYGFVRFGDENEQIRAMTEMYGVLCSTRPMRIGPAANTKSVATPKATYQSVQGDQGESDPNNTTIFVGGLDPNVSDEYLKQVFSRFGELVHVKIPIGKRCGFVQFANRRDAEASLAALNGTQIGGQNVRLSWGRSVSNKQSDQAQMNPGYYGYPQGYEAYGYAPQPQDPNMYYGGYQGYGNYQQQPQQ